IDNIFKNLRSNNHSVITINLHSSLVNFPGGIIKLDPRDLKNFKGDPEDMLKYLYKKFLGDSSKEDDKDDDKKDKYKEDRDHYYI
ncbi:unnamed protein product, partial [marine sediment metagenome]